MYSSHTDDLNSDDSEFDVMSNEQVVEETKVVIEKQPEGKITPYTLAMRRIERNMLNDFNCIPLPFERMRPIVPGIEQFTLNMITGSSGIGKSQLCDFLYLYSPVAFAMKHPDKIKVHIDYYSLEMSVEMKAIQAMCHHLFVRSGYKLRVSLKTMLSLNKKLDSEIFSLLKKEEGFYEKFYEMVSLKTGHIPPYALYRDMYDFADKNGVIEKQTVNYSYFDASSHKMVETQKEIFSGYKPNNPDLYYINVLDHAALLARQKGLDKRETIELYSQYAMSIRNMFGFISVSVNQQASDQEAKDNYKRPTLSGLGDNKATQRDYDYIFGIYDPLRHEASKYRDWPISKMGNRYREWLILKSRYGVSNVSTDLFFDGATNYFAQLPKFSSDATDVEKKEAEKWINYAANLRLDV